MIKYLGSKRVLIPELVKIVKGIPNTSSFLDLLSGTSRVAQAMKKEGLEVIANDHNAYAHTIAQCYVQADARQLSGAAQELIAELQNTPPSAGYFTETFCIRSRFFHPKNGARIDAIRERIEDLDLAPELRAIALVSLMEAADRVDSTTGVQMAYLKDWAPRAHNDLMLRVPDLIAGQGTALGLDALDCLEQHTADVIYIDPPYNQHSYLRNYHIWETLVRWDKPEVYGVACKRVDCRTRTSPYNSKVRIRDALKKLFSTARARFLMVSFSNEGYIDRSEMLDMLSTRGTVDVTELEYDRYVGARIGIYNPQGQKVGRVGHLRNIEYVFTVELKNVACNDSEHVNAASTA